MRAVIFAVLVAAGVGLIGTSNVSAAPASGAIIGDAVKVDNSIVPVQHWRSRSHWRWGSRGGHWRWGSARRCHMAGWSRMVRC